ncbi:NAD(P)-binding oxidoreductase [Cellulomonas sp. PhB143]|uniref:NAD(P)-binding oxidoreductase n=1 Tax=Cellulomonas sp. PhB143 TaxID=2485186 RepID=UPI000F47374D|nr:NAD(P)-binding oxidoreductase [Cellulomonas sp. PhB143]ROS79159.1 putative NADH-flavin reductase [Cellulomonas sp. PhB143]
MAKIAIIGAHGKVGSLVVPVLTARGHEVSGVVRSQDQFQDLTDAGATPVLLDVATASEDELAEAFAGHDVVVWSAGAGGKGGAEATYAVDRDAAIRSIDAARRAGAHRYVMVSFISAVHDHGVPEDSSFFAYADAKVTADDHLRASDLAWTILGPGTLTDEPSGGGITILRDDAPVPEESATSRENVARVIAEVVGRPRTAGHFLRFTDGRTVVEEAVHEAEGEDAGMRPQ